MKQITEPFEYAPPGAEVAPLPEQPQTLREKLRWIAPALKNRSRRWNRHRRAEDTLSEMPADTLTEPSETVPDRTAGHAPSETLSEASASVPTEKPTLNEAVPDAAAAGKSRRRPAGQAKRKRSLLLQFVAVGAAFVLVTDSFGLDFLGNDGLFNERWYETETSSEETEAESSEAETTKAPEEKRVLHVGDVIAFGKYPQAAGEQAGSEDIPMFHLYYF